MLNIITISLFQLIVSLIQRQAARVTRSGRSMTPAETTAFLDAVASRIGTAARLHRMLSAVGDAATVDFSRYLSEICDMLRESIGAGQVLRYQPPAEGTCVLPTDKALPSALIVVEAVTNAMKYAHPTGVPAIIQVSCRRDGDAMVLEICDDGVGFPEDFNPAKDGGVGIQAMGLLSRSVGGALSFESDALGLTCRVALPLQSPVS